MFLSYLTLQGTEQGLLVIAKKIKFCCHTLSYYLLTQNFH